MSAVLSFVRQIGNFVIMRFLLAIFLVCFVSEAYTQKYAPIDSESKVSFKIKNFGSTIGGNFKGLKGTIDFDANAISNSAFDVTVDAATIDTGIKLRDNHLRKAEYFDVSVFTTIRFVSTKVIVTAKSNEAIVTGNLTIKKMTKEISFPFRYKMIGGSPQFIGEFQIDRRDYGVGGSSITLSDELMVMLDVKASK